MHDDPFTRPDAIVWRKSSHSTAQGEDCVEVAALPENAVGLRDSKDPAGPRISLTFADWRSLIHQAETI